MSFVPFMPFMFRLLGNFPFVGIVSGADQEPARDASPRMMP
jgi:hypothetical protein